MFTTSQFKSSHSSQNDTLTITVPSAHTRIPICYNHPLLPTTKPYPLWHPAGPVHPAPHNQPLLLSPWATEWNWNNMPPPPPPPPTSRRLHFLDTVQNGIGFPHLTQHREELARQDIPIYGMTDIDLDRMIRHAYPYQLDIVKLETEMTRGLFSL